MYTFIDSIEDLAFLNKELLCKQVVAVDTEFRRTKKDNMKLALLQINDNDEIYLIDTISINNPKNHASFLFSQSVTKVFHSCKEDLEAIHSWTNAIMRNIFDTQLANSFLGNEYSIGYQGLVEKQLGIVLEKKETRSNWTRRPLSDAQLKYAALDVEYLIHLYGEQFKDLKNSNKLNWYIQDVERLIETTFSSENPFFNLKRSISTADENTLLQEFNKITQRIADDKKINSTLFFSKKSQKDFLRFAYLHGLEAAYEEITEWRRELIKNELPALMK